MDDLLKSLGINTNGVNYDEMTKEEQKTLHEWLDAFRKNELTVAGIKSYIVTMRDSVELELTNTSISSKEDIFLKARLKNYLMMEAFLTAPEKAKKYLEQSLNGLKK